MINLLPIETKKELRAARTNVMLIRYLAFLGFALAFMVLVSGGSYWFLMSAKDANDKLFNNKQNTLTAYEASKKQLDSMLASVSTVKSITYQQVSYSSIISELASVLPNGIILSNLNIDNDDIDKPIAIKARAINDNAVNSLKNNFSNSSMLSAPTVQSSVDNQNTSYPVAVTINLIINRVVK